MKTHTVFSYSFAKLSEEAKQKAIENLSDINVYYKWWEFTYLDAKEIGLKITSFDLDRNRHAKGNFLMEPSEVANMILKNHGENCETYKTAQNFLKEWQPVFACHAELDDSEDVLSELENDFLSNLLEDYSIILQNEYEYLTSEEVIIDTIEANGYEFTEEGKLF